MKTKKLFKCLRCISVPIILLCIVVVSVSLTPDSQRQMKEHHTDEVLSVIGQWRSELASASGRNRNYKANAFQVLSDFRVQLSTHDFHCDKIDSEFTGVLSDIVDWFFEDYLSMIENISEDTAGNINDIHLYLAEISENADILSDFTAPDEGELVEEEPAEDDSVDERIQRAEAYAQLRDMNEMLVYDDFISRRIDANEQRLNQLSEILSLVEYESIVERERIITLHGMVDSLIEANNEADNIAAVEKENILDKIDTELLLQRAWFEEHYSFLIDETTTAEAEDEYDDATVIKQIEDLLLVKKFIEDDGVVCADYTLLKNEQINQLIDEYIIELTSIEERIAQREAEAAAAEAAAAAAAANNRNSNSATNSSSNNRTSNNNNSGNNNSGSSNSGSSSSGSGSSDNTQVQSGSDRELLARLIKLEAPNECADGKQAVAEVVLNRVRSSRWSHANTVEAVIFDTKWGVQFAVKDLIWTDRGTPTSADYAAADRALGGSTVLGSGYVFFATRPITQIDVIWIGNHAFSK